MQQMFYPMCYTMRECVIQCKNVFQMKKGVIQREKVLSNGRNVLYNATNVIFDKKNRPRKIVITKKKKI